MSGTWSETNKQSLPGFYNRFKTIAENRIEVGTTGVLAMPVKANWGPVKTVTSVTDEKALISNFGNNANYTAYKLGRLALLGQPKELLLYRLTDGSEAVATCNLQNTAATSMIKLNTKYPTTRAFNVTIKTNLVDDSAKDLVLYEDAKQLFTITDLKGTIDEIVTAINNNEDNVYIIATKVSSATGTLVNVSNTKFIGGNDGVSSIANENYINAMAVFEGYTIDAFALDGISDASLQTTVKTWTNAQKENGNDFISFVGGSTAIDIVAANSKSKELNSANVVNVGDSLYYEDVLYSPAEVAVYIAALSIGLGLKESICNMKTIFTNVKVKRSKIEIATALKAGTLVFSEENGEVKIVDDKNTFTEYSDEKGEFLGYIRAIRLINTVDRDTAISGNKYIGKTINDGIGQISVICSLKQYFETFAAERIIKEDFIVEVDSELQANAKDDEFFWKWNADYNNVMKRIYGTGYIK